MKNQNPANDQEHKTQSRRGDYTPNGVRCLQEHGREEAGHENLSRQEDTAAHLGRHPLLSNIVNIVRDP
jgi:hypothetical protein